MYKNKYSNELIEEDRYIKRWAIWVVGFLMVVALIGGLIARSINTVDTAILRYEEFQEIYNTCQKINTDLATIRVVPESDRMFASFSKEAMIAGKKQQLARWVEEYNAKSKMWNRSLWKSRSLPYQLTINEFANY